MLIYAANHSAITSKLARFGREVPVPLLAVAAVVAWNLWSLRAVVLPVAFLNDGSVHEMMARYASSAITAGKDPYTSWFPYIGLGSAQYLHYQSLGSVLTGLAGVVVGPDTAFRWSVYLLLSLWPFVIYSSARLFGIPRAAAAIAAMLSPFIVSFTGVGYERGAYLWIGGAEVWTQLVGSWALPFAWASSWRAMRDARYLWVAGGLTRVDGGTSFHERRPRFPWGHRYRLGGRGTGPAQAWAGSCPFRRIVGGCGLGDRSPHGVHQVVSDQPGTSDDWVRQGLRCAPRGHLVVHRADLRCAPRHPGDHRRSALGGCTGNREVATGNRSCALCSPYS